MAYDYDKMLRPVSKLRKAKVFIKLFWWWNLINLTEFPVDNGPPTEMGATEYKHTHIIYVVFIHIILKHKKIY